MPTRTLMIEIARPADRSWDELGLLLRTQRKIIPLLLQAGMDARIACGVVPVSDVKAAISPGTKGESPGALAYQAINRQLSYIQSGHWNAEEKNALQISSGIIASLSRKVSQTYKNRPSYLKKDGHPIYVPGSDVKILTEGDLIILQMKLLKKGVVKVFARPTVGWHWGLIRKMASGEVEHGDCKIIYKNSQERGKGGKRKKKWYVFLSFEKEAAPPLTVDTTRALIVHRGVHNALTFMSTTGLFKKEPGEKLMAQLTNIDARIQKAKTISNAELGSGAKGRGKKRRYKHSSPLKIRRRNIIRTWCGQMAARLVKLAGSCGCGLIVIEDYGGIPVTDEDPDFQRRLSRFPFFELKRAIRDAVEMAGMTLQEVPSAYVSTTCPVCKNCDLRQHLDTGTFKCLNPECEYARDADFIAALNMLHLSGVDSSLWDERIEQFLKVEKAVKQKEQNT